jgi:methyl-accepting chemotaxis protein
MRFTYSSFTGTGALPVQGAIILLSCLAALPAWGLLPAWATLACLGLLALVVAPLNLAAIVAHKDLLRRNILAARSLAAGDYQRHFEPAGAGLALECQEALAAMLTRFKREYSLANGVMMAMNTPCAVVDLEENFIFGNPGLIRMVEHSGKPGDYYGQNVAYFFYGDAGRPTVLRTAMRDNTAISKEVEFTGRRGTRLNIHIDASPLYDIEGKLMGALCIYTDLTAIRKSEARLKEQNEKISQAVAKIGAVSSQLFDTAGVLKDLVQGCDDLSCRQASRAGQTSTAMGEMNAVILEVARNASLASNHSEKTQHRALAGASVVDKAVAAIGNATNLTQELKANLGQLGRRAEDIGRIMDVISDIADQTNLLALNAAIEAARAGDAGRGFAVVADEVRKLAEKTMGATKEVGDSIATIQEGAKQNLRGMDSVSQAVQDASDMAGESGAALREIVSLITQTSSQIGAIAAAAEEQSAASEQITTSVAEVRASSDDATRSMTEASRSVAELVQLADQLRVIITEVSH